MGGKDGIHEDDLLVEAIVSEAKQELKEKKKNEARAAKKAKTVAKPSNKKKSKKQLSAKELEEQERSRKRVANPKQEKTPRWELSKFFFFIKYYAF